MEKFESGFVHCSRILFTLFFFIFFYLLFFFLSSLVNRLGPISFLPLLHFSIYFYLSYA